MAFIGIIIQKMSIGEQDTHLQHDLPKERKKSRIRHKGLEPTLVVFHDWI